MAEGLSWVVFYNFIDFHEVTRYVKVMTKLCQYKRLRFELDGACADVDADFLLKSTYYFNFALLRGGARELWCFRHIQILCREVETFEGFKRHGIISHIIAGITEAFNLAFVYGDRNET